jgi:hypothetical protein
MKQKHTLAEIESYVRKAAQATGLDWGIAEEAGKAARWLAAYELPGVEITLAHLQQLAGKDYRQFMPTHLDDVWRAQGDYLCPFITGAALADRSYQLLTGTEFRFGPVAYPVLLVAMVGQAARYHRVTFTTSWSGVSISCYESGIRIKGNRDELLAAEAESVKCLQSKDTSPQSLPSTLASDVDSDAWLAIDRLAFKTYAPATAESRAGAGAGLTDND